MQTKVVIFGLGDFAERVHMFFSEEGCYDVVAFTAYEQYIQDTKLFGLSVVPFEQIQESYPPDRYAMFVAVGYNKTNKARAEICSACKNMGYRLVTYISPEAYRHDDLRIGENCFVQRRSNIGQRVQIGDGVIIYGSHSVIGKESVIGDYCYLSSSAAIGGKVRIGPYSFIGMNATIRDHVTVAPECVIGAGAVILEDTVPKGVYRSPRAELLPITSDQLGGI